MQPMLTLVFQGWIACSFWRISSLLAHIPKIWVNPYQCHYWKLHLHCSLFYVGWHKDGWHKGGLPLRATAHETGAGVSSRLHRNHHHKQPERELCMGLSEENSSWCGGAGSKLLWQQIHLALDPLNMQACPPMFGLLNGSQPMQWHWGVVVQPGPSPQMSANSTGATSSN